MNSYQEQAIETAIYPDEKALEYTTLGLVSEAGEVAGKLKKLIRDNDHDKLAEMRKELGDVLWYVATLAHELGTTLDDLAEDNLAKLRDRAERGTLQGSGDNR